ncbi:RadC family protein [Ralstonia pseudosolanacearum]|uniref:RadC family protein n=1 Tax=Ralstonia pseudosolanacearum TaxID=1310165 RepID=UPI0008DA4BD8|nr:DNA repair protein RadC [Ralstonia pseudosolanacearum]MCL1618807.1 DNA repair protein RadC [Ralstonia pseudosolanacearum CaRs-Mep]MCQ4681726.1 DNA repair protein RadC [Ralstonia pseudosolanacearum]
MAIADWPAHERPREKLLTQGPAALSDAELLAIFLRVGMPGKNAVDLARELLAHFGSLGRLCHASRREFSAIHGMGPAKYAQLHALLEVARRALKEEIAHGQPLESPQSVKDFLRLTLGHRPQEVFACLFLDVRHRLIAWEELFQGTLTEARVYPREIAKRALHHNASALILSHNHPTGHVEPSESDLMLTRELCRALALLDVRVLDHMIVGRAEVYSFLEHGKM